MSSQRITPDDIVVTWSVFGGWTPYDKNGQRIRGRKWRPGDMPPRFRTPGQAIAWAVKELTWEAKRKCS